MDDVITCSHALQAIMDDLALTYDLKEGSVREPTIYLGAEIKKYHVKSGKEHYSMSSMQYLKNEVNTVEQLLLEDGRTLRDTRTSGKQPLHSNYQPELEKSDKLSFDMISRYLQLIGILRWSVEIGRIDIFTEVNIMSQYSASPRLGHLEGLYHISGYLKKHEMSQIVFDPNKTKIDEQYFAPGTTDWRDFYVELME